jgi:hypothetical protein
MSGNAPIVEVETMFLAKEDDLLTLNEQSSNSNVKPPRSAAQLTALMMTVTASTALPVLLFRICPGVASRLSVILLLAPFVAFVQKPPRTELLHDCRDLTHFMYFYLGALVLSALVV